MRRRLPIGAECTGLSGVHFRLWAPNRRRVEVVLERGPGAGGVHALAAESGGYFQVRVPEAADGTLYGFRLDGSSRVFPDPASRAQPDGPHGLSRVVDPSRFEWSDVDWRGASPKDQLIYEMHIGTFTREGTWAAAARQLPELAGLGVTLLEIMPIAEFPGRFGWGYDGVNLFAPTRLYGSPDDARAFVDRAHSLGLGVILDVVYNHVGPDGDYLREFSEQYFSDTHATDWGVAINYDGPGSGPVRERVIANAAYWVEEFHFDGLRLDATQDIHDSSQSHILLEIGRAVRKAGGERRTFIVAENEPQNARLVRPADAGGYELDALWNDDFHHTAHVALTGHREAYYSDYGGTPQELVSAMKYGFLYQGQRYAWQKGPRGTASLDLEPRRLIAFLENHDQVANTARGQRAHELGSPGRYRALTTATLLGPNTPMLFQGQEFAASAPFLYFADSNAELAPKVRAGRREFLAQFPSLATPEASAVVPAPEDVATFERCKLDFSQRTLHAAAYALHRDLLALRRGDGVLGGRSVGIDGSVLTPDAFLVRFFASDHADRLLIVNLGRDTALAHAPEPLLAPPTDMQWELIFSSENPSYGGGGTPPCQRNGGEWHLQGEAAVVLRAVQKDPS